MPIPPLERRSRLGNRAGQPRLLVCAEHRCLPAKSLLTDPLDRLASGRIREPTERSSAYRIDVAERSANQKPAVVAAGLVHITHRVHSQPGSAQKTREPRLIVGP